MIFKYKLNHIYNTVVTYNLYKTKGYIKVKGIYNDGLVLLDNGSETDLCTIEGRKKVIIIEESKKHIIYKEPDLNMVIEIYYSKINTINKIKKLLL